MKGQPIDELNDGLLAFQTALQEDVLARRRCEIAVVTFGKGGVNLLQDFVTVENLQLPRLEEGNGTPIGEAINTAIDALERRKGHYRQQGLAKYRPWVWLVTDGKPTDEWQAAAARARQMDADKHLVFFAVGVQGADMQTLAQIAPSTRPPLLLQGLAFREMFLWLSDSLGSNGVSGAQPGSEIQLSPVNSWARVGV
jgi:uncharacterized protein YegL